MYFCRMEVIKAFDKLTEQLARLKQELADVSALLDKQLQYFIKHMYPLTQEVVALRIQAVLLLNGFMTISKGLSSHEKEALGQLILNQLHEIFRHQQGDPEGELLEIFNAISEVSYHDLYLAQLKTVVDTPPSKDIYPMKLQREKILEDARQKSIQQLYRQLAKVLHPDLEQDPSLISVKEELMKQLTVAKERGDLLTMLQLELSWMQKDKSPEQLKLYNVTLREQIKDLQAQIQALFLHPRYACLQGMAKSPQALRFIDWKSEKRNLESLREGMRHIILGLSQEPKKALKVVKQVI
jgi:hypothetical protein